MHTAYKPWPGSGSNHNVLRRLLLCAGAALICVLLLPTVAARADTPSTLTVVGTSDVQDSGLMPLLITPMFEKAYPAFTLKYVSVGTGVAINDAESGVASALLVHAAALENQFVAQGFSKERFGRAIFYGDYVLLGPASDPAGVLANAPHDMATAFARIAAAGAAGKADFVSRGGTPGTTVQEHAIWALDAGTPGLTLCNVSDTNGGGEAPSTASGACPTTTSNPPWYHTTGLTQGPNIEAANTCNFTNAGNNGANDCYVFTDRGTFECLTSAACAGGSVAPSNLRIVARDNSATAKGGQNLLINSFHAYAINPAAFAGNPNVQINSTAATDFLNFLTSPSFQAQLKSFLGSTSDPPFIADASPKITITSGFPGKVQGGKKVTISGSIANVVPGTPALANQTVSVNEVLTGGLPGLPIASGKTNSAGAFSITFSPTSTGSYVVTTNQITQIENSLLNPVFGDLLQPASTAASKVTVQGALQGVSYSAFPGRVLVTGTVLPGSGHVKGTVVVLARGKKGRFRKIATSFLGSGDHAFAISATRSKGTWFFEVRYQDPSTVLATTTRAKKLFVPARDSAGITTSSFKVKNGRFTLKGRIAPKPSRSGTIVQVLGLDAGPLNASAQATGGGSPRFRVIATVRVRGGATKFMVRGGLKRGEHWILELKYEPGGAAGSAYGGLRSVRVT
ncbi:MAG: substrate-binding domain-containing protein [Solirubrobacterales bacterium]|nr:substrate-binding domain-containing protein [Solirubrobacterales bacterium]